MELMSSLFFDHILGHAHAKRLLRRAITGPRRAHAYLFEGPQGVGKMALARVFAAALLCPERGEAVDPCGRCRSCAGAARGAHPYFIYFARPDDKKVISIESLREGGELERKIALKPWGSPNKIICFDDAETLHIDAANWLLKFIEEPPSQTVFLLVTSIPRQLPSTVRSRCQRVRFGGLSHDDAMRVLSRSAVGPPAPASSASAQASAGRAPAEDLEALLRLADGSPGTALALREEGVASLSRRMRDVFADLARGRYGASLDALVKDHSLKRVGMEDRVRLRLVLGALAGEVAAALRGGAGGDGGPPAEASAKAGASPVADWARQAGPDRTLDALERLLDAQREVAMNTNPPIVLEAVFGHLADVAGGPR